MSNGVHASSARNLYGRHGRINPSGRGPKKSHPVRNTLLVLLFLILAAVAAAGVVGYKFYTEAMQVKDHEMAVVDTVKSIGSMDGLDANALDAAIPQIQQHTSAARQITQGKLWEYAAKVPKYGDNIKTVKGMTEVLDDLTSTSLPKLSEIVKTLQTANLSDGKGGVNLQPIQQIQSSFTEVNNLLQQQNINYQNITQPNIDLVKNAYEQGGAQFSKIADQINAVNDMLNVLPQFLGQNGARQYLVIAYSTSEARSSGGLIGSLGTMTADNGKVTVGDFHPNAGFVNVYHGGNSSEESVFSSPLNFNWDIRDWMAVPDFSRTAEVTNKIWRYTYGSSNDGVMAIDPVFIQEMIGITGDITLDNGMTLTGKNTAEFLLNGIYKDVPVAKQDYYFEFVAKSAMSKMFQDLSIPKMLKMTQAMGTMAEGRHLYMYTFHDDEAKNFQGTGLAKNAPSSEEAPEVGIYFNQQNASKLDWYMKRKTTITRTAGTASGKATYHVRLEMTNSVSQAEVNKYGTYLMGGVSNAVASKGTSVEKMLFYAPAGGSISNITASGNHVTKASKVTLNGATTYTSVATLKPGETAVYEFDITTSGKATQDLKLDQTPMCWTDPNVTYNY